MVPGAQLNTGSGKKGGAQHWCLLCTHLHKLHWVLRQSLRGAGVPRLWGLKPGCYACNPLLCTHSRSSRQPGPLSPWVLPPEMEPLSPENGAMWQCSQTLACDSSNLRAADCCSAINTTRAINKHYLSALVFLMPGHCALACGATQRLKAGFRDESKLLRGAALFSPAAHARCRVEGLCSPWCVRQDPSSAPQGISPPVLCNPTALTVTDRLYPLS